MVIRSRRGTSTLGCLVSLLILAAALYYGINIGELYLRYYQLSDAMDSQARVAPSLTDAVILRRLQDQVDALGLPSEAGRFKIRRSGRPPRIVIETTYQESVSLPFFNHTFTFTPRAEEPL